MILAVDFDGTICDTDIWLGPEVPGAIGWIRRLQQAGAHTLLFTNRIGPTLTAAKLWLAHRGIVFPRVNSSWFFWQRLYPGRKPFWDYLADDRNAGCPLIKGQFARPIVQWTGEGGLGPWLFDRLEGRPLFT